MASFCIYIVRFSINSVEIVVDNAASAVEEKIIKPDVTKNLGNAVATAESLEMAEPQPVADVIDAGVIAVAAAETAEDELARELEEIEGPKKIDEDDASAASSTVGGSLLPEVIADVKSTVDSEQKTADLLKDLESDVVPSSAPTKAEEKSNEIVDSTTETSLKRKHSSDNLAHAAVAKKANVESVVAAKSAEPAAATTSRAEVDNGKEEAITSTSSDAVKKGVALKADSSSATTSTAEADSSKSPPVKEKSTKTDSADGANVSGKADVDEKMDVDLDDTDAAAASGKDNGTFGKKVENKHLTNMMNNGSSTPKSPASPAVSGSANVFNSTPIQKQFEVKSENVSKIDEHNACEKGATTDVTTDASSVFSKSGWFLLLFICKYTIKNIESLTI